MHAVRPLAEKHMSGSAAFLNFEKASGQVRIKFDGLLINQDDLSKHKSHV